MILRHAVYLDAGESVRVTVQHSNLFRNRSAETMTVEVVFPRGEKSRTTLQNVVTNRTKLAAWGMRKFHRSAERPILYLRIPRTANKEHIKGMLDELFPAPTSTAAAVNPKRSGTAIGG